MDIGTSTYIVPVDYGKWAEKLGVRQHWVSATTNEVPDHRRRIVLPRSRVAVPLQSMSVGMDSRVTRHEVHCNSLQVRANPSTAPQFSPGSNRRKAARDARIFAPLPVQGLQNSSSPTPFHYYNDHPKPMTNPNQPLPNAHPGSDDAHAAPMTPNSATLTGAGDRFEERLQSTLKKARLARDRAERTRELFCIREEEGGTGTRG